MKQLLLAVFFLLGLGQVLSAQDNASETPLWDPRLFIIENHLHQISGGVTIGAAALTGAAGIAAASGADWSALPSVHWALAYTTIAAGAATLALGLTAYSDRLDKVWPHVLFMGLAETGFILNAFVLEHGSLPHKITGAASITSLGLGLVSIILITAK